MNKVHFVFTNLLRMFYDFFTYVFVFLVNCTLKDLIDELNSVGCEFDFYSDNENYYTLVRYEKKRLLENIKEQKWDNFIL